MNLGKILALLPYCDGVRIMLNAELMLSWLLKIKADQARTRHWEETGLTEKNGTFGKMVRSKMRVQIQVPFSEERLCHDAYQIGPTIVNYEHHTSIVFYFSRLLQLNKFPQRNCLFRTFSIVYSINALLGAWLSGDYVKKYTRVLVFSTSHCITGLCISYFHRGLYHTINPQLPDNGGRNHRLPCYPWDMATFSMYTRISDGRKRIFRD